VQAKRKSYYNYNYLVTKNSCR